MQFEIGKLVYLQVKMQILYKKKGGQALNWKGAAITDLAKLENQKHALDSICERINILNDSYTSLKAGLIDRMPFKNRASHAEDTMLDNVVEREKLENTRKIISRFVKLTEKGLCRLTKEERRVLELFYIQKQKHHVERLMDELGYEKTKIYDLRERALYNFTINMYGILEC